MRTVSLLTSPCGSTVSRRRRCKQFSQCKAVKSGAGGAESVGKSNHRVLGHERYPRTSMINTVDTTIGNNLGLSLSHFHPKANLSLSSKLSICVMLVSDVSHVFMQSAHAVRQCDAHATACMSSLPHAMPFRAILPLTHHQLYSLAVISRLALQSTSTLAWAQTQTLASRSSLSIPSRI